MWIKCQFEETIFAIIFYQNLSIWIHCLLILMKLRFDPSVLRSHKEEDGAEEEEEEGDDDELIKLTKYFSSTFDLELLTRCEIYEYVK